MSDHPHVYLRGHMVLMGHEVERVCDRCALTESQSRDCLVAMREEIAALRAQVEALKDGAGSLHKAYARGAEEERASVVAFLRARRDALKNDIARRQMTRAATDVENGAHRA